MRDSKSRECRQPFADFIALARSSPLATSTATVMTFLATFATEGRFLGKLAISIASEMLSRSR